MPEKTVSVTARRQFQLVKHGEKSIVEPGDTVELPSSQAVRLVTASKARFVSEDDDPRRGGVVSHEDGIGLSTRDED